MMSSNPNLFDDGETIQSMLQRIKRNLKSSKVGSYSAKPKPRRVKQKANRNLGDNVEFVYYDLYKEVDPRFWNKLCSDRFDKLSDRPVVSERQLSFTKHKVIQEAIEKLLKEVNLFKTVCYPSAYFYEFIKEFYANLNPGVFDKEDEAYGKVYIRGRTLDFSPELINVFLETLIVPYEPQVDHINIEIKVVFLAITGKENQFHHNHIKASSLTLSAAVLHKIAVSNWLSTKKHTKVSQEVAVFIYIIMSKIPVNFGEHVFSFINTCSNVRANTVLLPFSSLICSILLAQVEHVPPSILSPLLFATAKSAKCASAIYISSKLLKEGHINDISGDKEDDREKGKEKAESSKGKGKEKVESGTGFKGLRKFVLERLKLINDKRIELDKEEYDMKKLLEQLPKDDSDSDSSSYMSLGDDNDDDDEDLGPPEDVVPFAREFTSRASPFIVSSGSSNSGDS